MANVIVAFSKPEDAKNIRNILAKNGFSVAAVCTSGAQAINSADELGSGIVVCGARFADMVYEELYDCLPPGVRMLLVASPGLWNGRAPEEVLSRGISRLPETLGEAIEEFKSSEFMKEVLGEHIYTKYLEAKEAEWRMFRAYVTDWETKEYLYKY